MKEIFDDLKKKRTKKGVNTGKQNESKESGFITKKKEIYQLLTS